MIHAPVEAAKSLRNVVENNECRRSMFVFRYTIHETQNPQ